VDGARVLSNSFAATGTQQRGATNVVPPQTLLQQ
jgi:hypothetical protein